MSALHTLYTNRHAAALLRPRPFVEGVIGAAACSPEIPLPPQWMPWTFQPELGLQQEDAAGQQFTFDQITEALINALRETLANMRESKVLLPEDYNFDLSLGAGSKQAQWLTGFLFAHQQLQPLWQQAWELMQSSSQQQAEEAAQQLKHCLKVFSVLADPSAIASGDTALQQSLPAVAKTLPRALGEYQALADTLASYLPNQFESFTKRLD
ncbi:UPF0149 family protein [Alteromonas sp. ASW11-36]|uniref:UPF0149 family protein n=1 Tax=Alteromonas arenosi TaxID=3055817 RepID=A0ABT7T010_9ALTE|nr:UPF0149 family protein [Alteromonas sp. ASW11-36]MDM7861777.1 UPF0149 family protein [Alteromonas sp. ASW11-36]